MLLIARGFLGILVLLMFFLSVSLNTISLHTIINETAPFWIVLLGYLFLGERITVLQVIAMILCFSGVMVIAFHSSSAENEQMKTTTLMGVSVAVILSILFALMNVMNRSLKETHVFIVGFFNGWVGLLTALAVLAW